MKIKYILFAAFILSLFCVCSGPRSYAGEMTPGETVVKTIDESLKVLSDPNLKGMDKFMERRQKLWDIVKPVFDFEETSRRALGRHWLTLSSEQKRAFTDTFTNVLRDFYLGKSDSYRGEKIVYVREIMDKDRGKVQTHFFTIDGKKIVIDFSMHKAGGSWKVYDVTIEGVSLVSSYRSQFNSIIHNESFDGLMKKLVEKEEEIPDFF